LEVGHCRTFDSEVQIPHLVPEVEFQEAALADIHPAGKANTAIHDHHLSVVT
jgi:hypothetical protein